MKKSILALAATLALSSSALAGTIYPYTYQNCEDSVTINAAPKRAVVNDINHIDMAIALGIQGQMAGISGVDNKATKAMLDAIPGIPEVAIKYPNLENILGVNADFYVSGWNYGMKVGGAVTPKTLKEHGVNTFVLKESCIHVMKMPKQASIELLYDDILRLGAIFDKNERAQELVEGWKKELRETLAKIKNPQKIKVALYDSGTEKAFTAGKYAMPTALIEAVGAVNVMDDWEKNWGTVPFEQLASKQPEFLILVDYIDSQNAENSRKFLEQHPLMKETPAVKNKRYLVLDYTEITPSPANIPAIIKLAKALYPGDFE